MYVKATEFKADFQVNVRKNQSKVDELVEMTDWARRTFKKSIRGVWLDVPYSGPCKVRLYFDTEAEMAMFSLRWSEFIA